MNGMLAISDRFIFEDEYTTEKLMSMYETVAASVDGMPDSFHAKAIGEKVLHSLAFELRFRGMAFDTEKQLALISQTSQGNDRDLT